MDANCRPSLKRSICAIALLFGAFSADSQSAISCFDDEKLRQVSNVGRGTLIYVWSPRTVYSVQQMEQAARAAAAHGLDFQAVHDARVPPGELLALPSNSAGGDISTPPFVSLRDSSLPLCAPTLLASEALRHFPTAFVVTQQGVHRHPIVGAMPVTAWQQSISQRLQQP